MEPQEVFLNTPLPVMTGRDVFNIIATCRRDAFLYRADLLHFMAQNAQKPDALPAFLIGKIRTITRQPSDYAARIKDFNGKIWNIRYTPSSEALTIGARDIIIFSDLETEQVSFLNRLMGKKTNTLVARNCGVLVTAQERAFLAANKQSPFVIARPMDVNTEKHEMAVICEPIHGPCATLRYFKDTVTPPPSIGVPFIAAVTHNNGRQYIPVGAGRCIPLAADLTPYVFC